ncbi:Uncharacterized protein HZ326_22750 [Fusarium oxysporum f. sp. albedinis]|nr:Uncharacterized protein HZ326_22750 [Fusarium oxysporum f. sp. albedinis]
MRRRPRFNPTPPTCSPNPKWSIIVEDEVSYLHADVASFRSAFPRYHGCATINWIAAASSLLAGPQVRLTSIDIIPRLYAQHQYEVLDS